MSKTSTFTSARMHRDGSLVRTNPDGTEEVVPVAQADERRPYRGGGRARSRRAATHGSRSCVTAARAAGEDLAPHPQPHAGGVRCHGLLEEQNWLQPLHHFLDVPQAICIT
jgi:hypothetical protein